MQWVVRKLRVYSSFYETPKDFVERNCIYIAINVVIDLGSRFISNILRGFSEMENSGNNNLIDC